MTILHTQYLSSYFNENIIDDNGIEVADMNDGIRNIFKVFNDVEYLLTEDQNYLISEFEDGYPDLVATNSILANQYYWWWILLINRLEDPFYDLKVNWIYSILTTSSLETIIGASNE